VATAAGIVVVQSMNFVEPQHAAEIGQPRVDWSPKICLKPFLEYPLNVACESGGSERSVAAM